MKFIKVKKIKNLYSNFFNSSFAKSVMMITSGTIFAQALNTLLSPIITRIYSPEEYGVLTVYTALLGMISLLGALCYDSAIPIADDDEKAINVLALSIAVLLIITSILTLLLFIFGNPILKLFDAEIILKYRYFLSIGFFATGFYTILSKWALRKRDFKAIAATKYNQSIAGKWL